MSSVGRVAVGVLFSVSMIAVIPAQEHGKPTGDKPAASAPVKPAPVFVIAKCGDKLEVMTKEELEAKNKQMAEEFAKAKEAYDKEKAAAEAAHKKFEGKEPKKMTAEATGGDFASKAAAEAGLKKMQDEKAKAEKPKDKEKPKGDKPKGDGGKEHKKAPTR